MAELAFLDEIRTMVELADQPEHALHPMSIACADASGRSAAAIIADLQRLEAESSAGGCSESSVRECRIIETLGRSASILALLCCAIGVARTAHRDAGRADETLGSAVGFQVRHQRPLLPGGPPP